MLAPDFQAQRTENVVPLGASGVGKTYGDRLGLESNSRLDQDAFITAADLMLQLQAALR